MPHSDPEKINPPDPIEHEDGSVEWPTDPDFQPTEHPEQGLTPEEGEEPDDDFSETPEGAEEAEEAAEEEDETDG